jgi:hypothetical protein
VGAPTGRGDSLKTWLLAIYATILTVLFAVLAAKELASGLAVFG